MSAYGFGGFIFGTISHKLNNPQDIRYVKDQSDGLLYLPKEVGDNFPLALKTMVFIWLALIAVGLFLLEEKKGAD